MVEIDGENYLCSCCGENLTCKNICDFRNKIVIHYQKDHVLYKRFGIKCDVDFTRFSDKRSSILNLPFYSNDNDVIQVSTLDLFNKENRLFAVESIDGFIGLSTTTFKNSLKLDEPSIEIKEILIKFKDVNAQLNNTCSFGTYLQSNENSKQ